MKRFLLTFFGVLGLIKPATSTGFLDEPFEQGEHFGMPYKDLRKGSTENDPRYKGRSLLYNYGGTLYPKISIVHSYNHEAFLIPFSAFLPKGDIPQKLSMVLTEHPKNETLFSFLVQPIETGRKLSDLEIKIIQKREANELLNEEELKVSATLPNYYTERNSYYLLPHYSLKPQYFIHAEASDHYNEEAKKMVLEHKVKWTAIPGVQGKVKPELGEKIHEDGVSTHPTEPTMVPYIPYVNLAELQNNNEKEHQRVLAIMNERNIQADEQGRVDMDVINNVPIESRISTRAQAKNIAPINNLVNLNDIDLSVEAKLEKENEMILSGDSLHLTGLNPTESSDFYDFVGFEDQGKKIHSFTYRWVLNNKDFDTFNVALGMSNSFHELIQNLYKSDSSLQNMIDELQKYMGVLPRSDE